LIHALAEPSLYAMTIRNGEMYVAEIADLKAQGATVRG
jgi:hypothetical protein